MPELIIHKGYSIERIATTLWLTTEGIFGLPIGVAATFVFVFVLFGAFLESTGGGNFFIDLAYALTGRFSGGTGQDLGGGLRFHGIGVRLGRRQRGGHRLLHHPHDEKGRLPAPCGRRHRSGRLHRRTAHAAHHGRRRVSDGRIHQHQLPDHHQGGPGAGDHVLRDRADFRALRGQKIRSRGPAQGEPAPGGQGGQRRAAFHHPRADSDLRAGQQLLAHDGRFRGGPQHRRPVWPPTPFAGR
jgi:hypothetical protein